MLRRFLITTVLSLVVIGVGSFLVLAQNGKLDPRSGNKQAHKIEASTGGGLDFASGTGDAAREIAEEWKKHQDRFQSLGEVQSRVSFPLVLPASPIPGKLVALYIDKYSDSNQKTVTLEFESGVHIEAKAANRNVKFGDLVAQFKNDKDEGNYLGDTLPQNIMVKGNHGWGIEPGYNLPFGEKTPRAGFVQWAHGASGTDYTIYGTKGSDGTSLDALLEIANSID